MTQSLTDRMTIFITLCHLITHLLPAYPRVVDLGCGHCKFLSLARDIFGPNVVGIDARLGRVPEGVPVLQQRIQDADLSSYDLILCLGIFYHLTLADQIRLISRFESKLTIVDTHYARAPEVVQFHDGRPYHGAVFREGNRLTSSFGNSESFWPTEQELVRMLGPHHSVLKWLPEHHPGRSFYLLIPKGR